MNISDSMVRFEELRNFPNTKSSSLIGTSKKFWFLCINLKASNRGNIIMKQCNILVSPQVK